MDPDIFLYMTDFKEYVYSAEQCDDQVDRYERLGRIYMAIMLDERPIGEVILKNINMAQRHCTLGIHLQNDSIKNKGYGMRSEILALQFAFNELNIEVVYTDVIKKKKRSQHVLSKVGF